MELEKKRGISISSTVLQFDYNNYRLNLLDTPGHRDFSEDTYRVLMAVDGVIMVIDAAKGIESQTRKLFEICRKRSIPIFTFINKLDRHSMNPLELIDQLEKVLNLQAFPVMWPLGNGHDFKGVYDRLKKEVHLFERVPGGAYKAPVLIRDIRDPLVKDILSEQTYNEVGEEIAILDDVPGVFERDTVLRGETTPVFFGSAANNFGVELLLKGFVEYSSCPVPRKSLNGWVPLDNSHFSGFVFKVQTNMNPLHRDRMVFVRICSGKFYRDMTVYHARHRKKIRLASCHNVFGRNREIAGEAYPGDIIGFVTREDFRVGDTISTDPNLVFGEIPRFAPECFAFLHNPLTSNYKSFRKGVEHLLAEDIVQVFHLHEYKSNLPLLGAVGPLQFEVMQYRLKNEYGAESRLESMQWNVLRWVDTHLSDTDLKRSLPHGAALAADEQGRKVVLFQSEWSLRYFSEKNPSVRLLDTPNKTSYHAL